MFANRSGDDYDPANCLVHSGWSGLQVEQDEALAAQVTEAATGTVRTLQMEVTPENAGGIRMAFDGRKGRDRVDGWKDAGVVGRFFLNVRSTTPSLSRTLALALDVLRNQEPLDQSPNGVTPHGGCFRSTS